jgi:hypothetical protein
MKNLLRGRVLHWRSAILAPLIALGFTLSPAAAETVLRVSANTPVRSLDPAKYSLGAIEYNYSFWSIAGSPISTTSSTSYRI